MEMITLQNHKTKRQNQNIFIGHTNLILILMTSSNLWPHSVCKKAIVVSYMRFSNIHTQTNVQLSFWPKSRNIYKNHLVTQISQKSNLFSDQWTHPNKHYQFLLATNFGVDGVIEERRLKCNFFRLSKLFKNEVTESAETEATLRENCSDPLYVRTFPKQCWESHDWSTNLHSLCRIYAKRQMFL